MGMIIVGAGECVITFWREASYNHHHGLLLYREIGYYIGRFNLEAYVQNILFMGILVMLQISANIHHCKAQVLVQHSNCKIYYFILRFAVFVT